MIRHFSSQSFLSESGRKITREFLEALLMVKLVTLKEGDRRNPEIKDFKENHTHNSILYHYGRQSKDRRIREEKNGLYGKFKLTRSTSNMTLFDTAIVSSKYTTQKIFFNLLRYPIGLLREKEDPLGQKPTKRTNGKLSTKHDSLKKSARN
jgi:hypothetical protein